MSAILFGSLSTIADTSELQRNAFNAAFDAHGLGWRWERDDYLAMLERSGGAQRIAEYARSRGQDVDAAAVHATKSEMFQKSLPSSGVQPRRGVVETIQGAKDAGLKVALVTTTSPENIAALTEALAPQLRASDFDLVVDATDVDKDKGKPDPAAYSFALVRLGEQAGACVAVEDNVPGVQAATSASIACVAFPNQNTAGHDFHEARGRLDRLDLAELTTYLVG